MKFALFLYVLYCALLVAFVWMHPTDVSIQACILLSFFGAWFSRMMMSLERINRRLLEQESMHQLILQEHQHFQHQHFQRQQRYQESFFTGETFPTRSYTNHREWATTPLYPIE